MFREFFCFDLRYQLRSPLLWIVAVVFMLLAFGAVVSDNIQVIGPLGSIHRNAPSVIIQFLAVFTILGLLAAIAFIAQPVLRDFDLGTDELFFSAPMRKGAYLWGRVTAGLVAAILVYVLTALAILLGSLLVDPSQRGPFSLQPYLWAFGVIVLPDLVFIGALVSLLAITTRRLLVVFLGAIAFLVLWTIAGALMRDIQYDTIVSLMDPFGVRTMARFMRYWSVNERNTLMPDLTGLLLMNRLLWLGISALMIVAAHALFRPQRLRAKASRRKRKRTADPAESAALSATASRAIASPAMPRTFDAATRLGQFLRQLRFDAAGVVKSIPFIVLLAFGLLSMINGARTIDSGFGTPVYPVTALMLESMQGSYQYLLVFILTFYAGEVIWKERDARVAAVSDAMPVPDWVPLLAKIGALLAVVLIFLAVGALVAMLYQLAQGHSMLEPGLYLRSSLVDAVSLGLMAVLGVVLQVIANQKFVGYLLLILVVISLIALPGVHFEHNLYLYSTALDHDVLRHERLRQPPQALGMVPDATGRCSLRCWWCWRLRSGCVARLRAGASGGAMRSDCCAARSVHCWAHSRSPSSRSVPGSTTTPTYSTSTCRRTWCSIARRASRRTTASTRMRRSRASSTCAPTSISIRKSVA